MSVIDNDSRPYNTVSVIDDDDDTKMINFADNDDSMTRTSSPQSVVDTNNEDNEDNAFVNFDRLYVCETVTAIVLNEQNKYCLCLSCFGDLFECRENITTVFRPVKIHTMKMLHECNLCSTTCRQCEKSLVVHSKASTCDSCLSYCLGVYGSRATCQEQDLLIDYSLYYHSEQYECRHGCAH
ncbi:orf110 [Artaxa digramma nucleopolyhedrovirus]|uniref:Orf110 n=1 Tax=Artaxa digramma nucleopolyhedrovirus TaxID=3070910 RepID=A0AAE6R6Z9_9ABAC|nr:orf110 [Euproctis digramma nucleopolyhedrovirus]QHB21769.1 orf110 [Artaxa digramma nucleopolyhedrovirus]